MRKLVSVLLAWIPGRQKDTDRPAAALRRPDGRFAAERQPATPSVPTKEQINAGLALLNRAIQTAKEGHFDTAYALLRQAVNLLAGDRTAALQLSAAVGLVNALDNNHGIAVRRIIRTLKYLSDLWPNLSGGEHTYRQITAICGEAMRFVPLHHLGTDGAEVASLLYDAREANAQEDSEVALACFSRAQELIERSPTLKWHLALQRDVRTSIAAILKAITTLPDNEAAAFTKKCTEEYDRTRPHRHPAAPRTTA